MDRVTLLARAKINLALHVTGRRADGYHNLDMLVAFADMGDRVTVAPAQQDSFTVSGPFSGGLSTGPDNLVARARDALAAETGGLPPVAIHLEKTLPVASGIGGGSADAAATLNALARLFAPVMERDRLAEIAATLGADVPMCLASVPLHAAGTGDVLRPLAPFPALPCVLANCGRAVATASVFKALAKRDNPPLAPFGSSFEDAASLVDYLAAQRNDLQGPAIGIEPSIADTLGALEATGPLLARMSGSGATCFALYGDAAEARIAAATLSRAHPGWYVTATTLQGS